MESILNPHKPVGERAKDYYLALKNLNWIISTPLEKLIFGGSFLFTLYSIIKYVIGWIF